MTKTMEMSLEIAAATSAAVAALEMMMVVFVV